MSKINSQTIIDLEVGDIILNWPHNKNLNPSDLSNNAPYKIEKIIGKHKDLITQQNVLDPLAEFIISKIVSPIIVKIDASLETSPPEIITHQQLLSGNWYLYDAKLD